MKIELIDITVRDLVAGYSRIGDGRKRNREKSAN